MWDMEVALALGAGVALSKGWRFGGKQWAVKRDISTE
jgi:hypothetical protein